MSLSALIRKGGLARSATATPATPATRATQQAGQTSSVAAVATVTVAVQPESSIQPKKYPPSIELSADEESKIRAWLTHIEEIDPDIIAEVLEKCRSDIGARAYFFSRVEEVDTLVFDDG